LEFPLVKRFFSKSAFSTTGKIKRMKNHEQSIETGDGTARESRQTKNRLKRKLNDSTTYEDLVKDWSQCCYLIPHKQKLCNISRTAGSNFCGNHRNSACKDVSDNNDLKRIPCPLDPSHSIYERNLFHHLKICNKEKIRKENESLPFYRLNCNSGDLMKAEDVLPSFLSEEQDRTFVTNLLTKIQEMFEVTKVCETAEVYDENAPNAKEDQIESVIRCALDSKANQLSFHRKVKHIEQDIAIVKQLIAHELLSVPHSSSEENDKNNLFIEYGAGKGLLGLSVNAVNPNVSLLFVERSGNRRKIDKVLVEKNCSFSRYRLDIRHCYLPKLPQIVEDTEKRAQSITLQCASSSLPRKKKVNIIAKHLCGVATDLAIRSLTHMSPNEHCQRGLAIATCCHHACCYEDYVGREVYFDKYHVSKAEFDVMRYWTGT
jgi:tRNA:m4X modification enzyme